MRLKQTLFLIPIFIIAALGTTFSQTYRVKTIVIDAGHGGNKPGARGTISTEKNVALAVALKLGRKFEEEMPGVKVLYTRKTDVDVDFYKRAALANDNNADIFISIHCNSMADNKVLTGYTKTKSGKRIPKYAYTKNRVTRGTETFVAGSHRLNEQDAAIRENEDIMLEKNYKQNYNGYDPKDPETNIILSLFKNVFRDKSLKLARLVQDNYTKNDNRVNRGVKEQGLLILQRCGMPAILTEIGFISNPDEEEYINSDIGQAEIINSIFKAVKTYRQETETN